MCYSIVGFNFSPLHKKEIIKMVKQRFLGRPITLAIGDGLNDTLMFHSADISMELQRDKEALPSNAASIKIDGFECIRDILLIHGRNLANKTENVILYMFYKSFTFGFPLFFFNWFSSFTGTAIHDSMFVFLYSFLFSFFPIVIYGGFDKSEPEDVLRSLPALYIDGKRAKASFMKSFAIKSCFEGFVHASIAFYLSVYSISEAYDSQGRSSEFGMTSLMVTYSIIIITNIKVSLTYFDIIILKITLDFLDI